MANINRLTSQSTSSLYGTRNILSGLGSGLDTETMIENSVAGYKTKIDSLKQQQELVSWKQEAYNSIINKANSLSNNFFSYGSSTNLLSSSIYHKTKIDVEGADSSYLTAKGEPRNDIVLNEVSQIATASSAFLSIDPKQTVGDLFMANGEWPQDIVINGVTIGSYTSLSTLEDLISDINKSNAGITASTSDLLKGILLKAERTGADSTISFDNDFTRQLFAAAEVTSGQNARYKVIVNGRAASLESDTNTIDMDGMEVTLKKPISNEVSFTKTADTDTLVNGIKDFVTQYNDLAKAIRDQYKAVPLTTSTKESYKPLTETDKANMSDAAIKAYEDKAKQGLLYNDTDLENFYSKLTSAVSANPNELSKYGITLNYSNGLTTLSFDEEKFKMAGDSKEALHGMMKKVKDVVDGYASTSFSSPGILSKKASKTNTNSALNKESDRIQKQIDNVESKLSQKIDYYTRQFTALEKLMSVMNNQSSMLYDLMGG